MARQPVHAFAYSNHTHAGDGYSYAAAPYFPEADVAFSVPNGKLFVGTIRMVTSPPTIYVNGVPLAPDSGGPIRPLVLPGGSVVAVPSSYVDPSNKNSYPTCYAVAINGFFYDN